MAKSSHYIAVLLFVVGCGRDDIKVYTVPKEQFTPLTQAEMPAGHPDISESKPQLTWTARAGWTQLDPGEIRVASFRIEGANGKRADVSVIPLAGIAGGDLGNVNRWRGQVGLEPISPDELGKFAQPVTLAGQTAQLYDLPGESAHILAAVQNRAGRSWFFKMTGDDPLVEQQKPAFVEFLKSVQFSSTAPASAPPAVATASAGTPQWTAPADWKEVPAGQFLVAKYTIENGRAAVNISSSAGDGGGLAANVNRWRKQLGLGELSGEELAKAVTKVNDRLAFVELSGTDARSRQPAAVVGALMFQPDRAWFYKLTGDPKIIAAQKDAFVKFVHEVKY